ncbi:Orthopoxvirus protein of unknown function (DUF830) [Beggiatoa alba B18LD]|uniref:Uncharacterized protein n=1 Tax=Beggiatoa alba B18LD TaxID=395493 RepID=I3CFU2_9GAMM|nr:hypothetical protein [Beggiatoa alba]EIJ42485.1 Orthopoxvirus protein of unknown function (DUF830) [Beggiatoa alba B18LD]
MSETPTIQKKTFVENLMTVLSHLRFYKTPFFLTYRPHSFVLKGKDTREVMRLIKAGDILLRTHNDYLDNRIRQKTFTNAGFYLGEVTDNHLRQLAKVERPEQYATGEQIVIHAQADGVVLEDLIQFCRCDALAILRFPSQIVLQQGMSAPELLLQYFDAELNSATKNPYLPVIRAEKDIVTRLTRGEKLPYETLFKIFYRVALSQLSTPNTFDFGFDHFHNFKATELIYFIMKSICWNYGIEPQMQKVLFQQRRVIEPDAFTATELEEVWKKVG